MGGESEAKADSDALGTRLGLLWMLLATICFVAMSAFVKLLREDGLSTNEVMFWRMAPGLPWVWMELRLRKQTIWPASARPIIARSLCGLAAMTCYFYALRALSLIEYTVLTLLQPVFVAVLAPAILGERLRRSAIAALILGLAGALVVLRPDRGGPVTLELLPVAIGVLAALSSALAHVYVRKSTLRDSPERVVFWFTIAVSAVALIGGLASGDFLGGLPDGLELGPGILKIAGAAGFGLAGQLFMTRAYGRAAAPVVAIVAYAAIPASITLDLITWGLRPGVPELAGSILLIIAGVLLVRGRRA